MALAQKEIERPTTWKWSREDYYRLADMGFFEGKHVELLEGEIVEMSPIGARHATSVTLTSDRLRPVFGQGHFVRVQMPLAPGEKAEPEPDVAIIVGAPADYRDVHPATAALIVEVAEASLGTDRTYKASLYAKASILDYWIANLVEGQLEVHRRPEPAPEGDPGAPYGCRYADVTVAKPGQSVTPLAAPQAAVPVADLLP